MRVTGRKYCPSKIWRSGDTLYGVAGTSEMQMRWKNWLHTGEVIFNANGDENGFGGIQVSPGGVFACSSGFAPLPITPPEAIGTGAPIAMAVLEAGFDPRYAVKIACRMDPSSAEPIDFLLLDEHKELFTQTFIQSTKTWYKISEYTQKIVDISDKKFDGIPTL